MKHLVQARVLALSFVLLISSWVLPTLAESDHASPDQRQVLEITALQRQHVLLEMRALLKGVQGILGALADEDMAAVASIARPLGSAMAGKAEDHMKTILPAEFMQLGMSVHQDFDKIAASAEASEDGGAILRQLSTSMNKCLACHESYQIRSREPAGSEKKQLQKHAH
ncbi:MAG: hypothetical protein KBT88_11205 [Gammaproteobacteria bacterium]|nr:hypothetical protein [Gammaproteobacteria bacterium]MBQ0840342.1 hypothetical protein [Gammaproteobacteria bacterium]